jgi:hypothetical protein
MEEFHRGRGGFLKITIAIGGNILYSNNPRGNSAHFTVGKKVKFEQIIFLQCLAMPGKISYNSFVYMAFWRGAKKL